MTKKVINDSTLEAIADAIRDKNGSSDTYTPLEMPQAIEDIQTGGAEEKDVNFYDYDGTLLYSYTAAEFANVEAMPENPTHEGLIAQGWNWDLAEAKTYVANWGRLIIGQSYITDDGATRIYVDLDEHSLKPYIGLFSNGYFTIDWGDGSAVETFQGNGADPVLNGHTYAAEGSYVISIKPLDDAVIWFASRNRGHTLLITTTNNYSAVNTNTDRNYLNSVKKIEIGTHYLWNDNTIHIQTFLHLAMLETITIPIDDAPSVRIGNKTYTSHNMINSFQYCSSLKFVVVPKGITNVQGTFGDCESIKRVSFSNSITTFIAQNMFTNAYNLEELIVPQVSNFTGANAFRYCTSLKYAIIPNYANNATFEYNYSLKKVIVMNTNTGIISSNTFNECHRLENAVIPPYTTNVNIQSYAFNLCKALKEMNVPEGYTTIQGYAFGYCYSLVKLTLPSTVTSITNSSLASALSLAELHIKATTPPTLSGSISNFPATCKIYVPTGSLEAYQTATNWATYASQMEEE